ncbi:hypothetical protein BC059799_1124 [Bacillus cereus NVH0597-99]|nr:hypothetical protein BC059799_1124 [Bacillus cereus NVH0597-99]
MTHFISETPFLINLYFMYVFYLLDEYYVKIQVVGGMIMSRSQLSS